MLQGQGFQVARFQVLPNPSAAQKVPAMIAGHFIQPGRKRPRRIVGPEFLAYFHKDFSGGVFRVFARGQRPPAEPEYRRGVLPIQLAPGLDVARPDLRKHIR